MNEGEAVEKRETVELTLDVPAAIQSIETLILDLEQSSSRDDSLSVEVAISQESDAWDTFTLVDGEGFPLLTVTLRGQS